MTEEFYQDGIKLPMKEDDVNAKELMRIQGATYVAGKIDCLKCFKLAVNSFPTESVNLVNVNALIDSILKELENA